MLPIDTVKSDEQGRFSFGALPPGTFNLGFVRSLPDLDFQHPGLATGRTDHIFRFESPSEVTVVGTVRDNHGTPLMGVRIATTTPITAAERAVTNAHGEFKLRIRVPNHTSVLLVAEGVGFSPSSTAVTPRASKSGTPIRRDFVLHHTDAT